MRIFIDDAGIDVTDGMTVAAAILNAKTARIRRSTTGEARAPMCGMGICQECRVEIDGVAHMRSCMVLCRDGMRVRTSDA